MGRENHEWWGKTEAKFPTPTLVVTIPRAPGEKRGKKA